MGDSLHERGKAMEGLFYRNKDQQLLQQLREEMAADEKREALTAASGIADQATLDALLANGVNPETVLAISLVPLVAVAWADDKMEPKEVEAILKASSEAGVKEGSASAGLLESWLADQPGADLLDAWKQYVTSLRSTLDQAAFQQLENAVMNRALNVAKSAGGILGLASVSEVEHSVLDELQKVFS